jgi:peptidoglycan hydrolase-like protein with peptidoglycan-binding domain
MKRRTTVLGAIAIACALACGATAAGWAPWQTSASSRSPDHPSATSTAVVQRRTLSSRISLGGTLGYDGSYQVLGPGVGTITALPRVGQVLDADDVLYEVDGQPVILLYGATPAYRDLAAGPRASDVAGDDVAELNRALVELGYAAGLGVNPESDEFTTATKAAVVRFQRAHGLAITGKLTRGQVVFLSGPIRVSATDAHLGAPASGPVLTGTTPRRMVRLSVSTSQQAQVHVGDRVRITLPTGRTTRGRVASVGRVATAATSAGGASTVVVTVVPLRARRTGTLDLAPVQVEIRTATVKQATVVPVTALVALAGGGYAVETPTSTGSRLVAVSLGLFDDLEGLVQVTGPGLHEGLKVVVPSS